MIFRKKFFLMPSKFFLIPHPIAAGHGGWGEKHPTNHARSSNPACFTTDRAWHSDGHCRVEGEHSSMWNNTCQKACASTEGLHARRQSQHHSVTQTLHAWQRKLACLHRKQIPGLLQPSRHPVVALKKQQPTRCLFPLALQDQVLFLFVDFGRLFSFQGLSLWFYLLAACLDASVDTAGVFLAVLADLTKARRVRGVWPGSLVLGALLLRSLGFC